MKNQILLIFLFLIAFSSLAEKPSLQLSGIYQSGTDVKDYWVSEKFDGVRGYWNGKQMISRQGNVISTPDWFIEHLPTVALDGELWSGRGEFDYLSGIVRKKTPREDEWRNVKYMIFDLPGSRSKFDIRLRELKKIITKVNKGHIELVEQRKVSNEQELMKLLDSVVGQGGEGLMLHRGSSIYKSRRTDDLLKLKKFLDAEAEVIKQLPGKGKFSGMMGALLVETPAGIRFKIGTGFSNAERRNPPLPGSIITFRYFGLTSKGKPRFASFIRVREEH